MHCLKQDQLKVNYRVVLKLMARNIITFGVGALDEDPVKTGAEYAKNTVGIHQKKQLLVVLILYMNTFIK